MKLMVMHKSGILKSAFLLFSIAGALLFLAGGFGTPEKSEKPNIIVILVDDAGYADFGFMGSRDIKTPNLDALASGAVRFTDAHVTASVCSPSRAGLLTGKYQQRFGYECNEVEGYSGIDTLQQIIPAYLQQAGYYTAAFGKWHLGYEHKQHPLLMGFDFYYGFLSGGRSYFYRPLKDDKPGARNALLENDKQVSFDGYLSDVLGNKAAAFIRENKSRPFFMYWTPNAVHTPMEADTANLVMFKNHPRKTLMAMTYALDRAVGTIVNELKRQALFDNTIIFFLSDNGGAHNNQSNNGSLKGFKGNEYEAGHRIPFLVSWPARFSKGSTFQGLSSSLDIAPTILEVAGVPGAKTFSLDGVSLLPFLTGVKKGNPHRELVWRKDAAAAIRVNQYKLIRIKGLGERLYNLQQDPGEQSDIRDKQPVLFRQLKQGLVNCEKNMLAPLWTEGAVWDTITLMIHDDLMHNRKMRVHDPEELQNFKKRNPKLQP